MTYELIKITRLSFVVRVKHMDGYSTRCTDHQNAHVVAVAGDKVPNGTGYCKLER